MTAIGWPRRGDDGILRRTSQPRFRFLGPGRWAMGRNGAPEADMRRRRSSTLSNCAARYLAMAAGAAALSGAAQAQVIEVGAGGQVAVYNGPTVFTDAGATPIASPAVRAS